MDTTVANYVVLAIVVYYGILFGMSFRRPQPMTDAAGLGPIFVFLVPARNEELVLGETIANLIGLAEPHRCRVLVINDGSTDDTEAIAEAWGAREVRVRVIHRRGAGAGRGKSDVLNHGYRTIREWCIGHDPWLDGHEEEHVVIGIIDADGRLQPNVVATVSPRFARRDVASVQIGVRIANAGDSTLARMQDIEFVGFSWVVQIARDRLGSSGLGGNGQFTRLDALAALGVQPWSPGALTEDLDLGLRLITLGWRTSFCPETWVDQQGLDKWRPLLRQRTRWIQGHYQCWRHIPVLCRARRARLVTRLDLINYLLLVVTVLLVSTLAVVNGLASLGLADVQSSFLDVVPAGAVTRAVSLGLSLLPLSIFMWTYQRHSAKPFRWYELPTYAVLFTLYTYVWLLTSLRALARLAMRRNGWVKTPRVAAPVSSHL